VVAALAAVFVAYQTCHGVTATRDSAAYLGTAHELRAGHGPSVPSTFWWDTYSPRIALGFDGHVPSSHFPPGYPLLLALSSAWFLGIALVFVNAVLIGLFAARLSSCRSWVVAAVPVALLVLVPDARGATGGPGWFPLHTSALSEPLFMALATGALLLLPRAVTSNRMLALATALAAGALLTRYIGIAVALTLLLVLMARGQWRRGLVAAGATLVPLVVFLGWVTVRGGGSARMVQFHLAANNGRFFRFAGYSFFPFAGPNAWRTIGVVVVTAAFVAALWATRALRDDLYRAGVVYVVAYLVLVVLTRTFLDANTPFDARLLAPIRGIVYALGVALAYELLQRLTKPVWAAATIGVVALALVVANWGEQRKLYDTMDVARLVRTPSEQALASLPKDALIVTNTPDVVWNRAGRASYMLPGRVTYITRARNANYERDLDEWKRVLAARPSYAFFGLAPIAGLPTAADLAPLRLTPVVRSGDETLYRIG
jgi:hypothetical protein